MDISGIVLDSSNEPLYLANITITTGSQNNKFGTIANHNGEFNLSSDIIKPNSKFKISYLGFQSQFYKASELQNKTIKLEDDIIGLKEVVISPKNKPKNKSLATQPSNIKQHFEKHKLVYAGLGGIVAIGLILTSIKKLK
jgi:hypothetical protein